MSTDTRTRDVLERVARQLLQVYGPTVVVVLTSATDGDVKTTVVALLTVVILTSIKLLSGLRSKPGDPAWLVIADRAGSAFGLQLAGLGVADLADLMSLDWGKALGAAVIAAALAAVMYYVTPPANPPTPVEAGPDGSFTVTDAPAAPAGRDGETAW